MERKGIIFVAVSLLILVSVGVPDAFADASIMTEKPIYFTVNDVAKIVITGTLPDDLPICNTIPATPPNQGFSCDPLGSGPSIETVRPNGNSAGVLSYVPGFTDDVFVITGLNFETFEPRSNVVNDLGIWTIHLWSGNGGSGEILASTTFTVIDGSGGIVPIGGTDIPIDRTALLLAGAQSISMWMIPVILAGIGIGVFVIKRRN